MSGTIEKACAMGGGADTSGRMIPSVAAGLRAIKKDEQRQGMSREKALEVPLQYCHEVTGRGIRRYHSLLAADCRSRNPWRQERLR